MRVKYDNEYYTVLGVVSYDYNRQLVRVHYPSQGSYPLKNLTTDASYIMLNDGYYINSLNASKVRKILYKGSSIDELYDGLIKWLDFAGVKP